MQLLRFEWDPRKAAVNARKHGVTFDDAMRVFEDPYALFDEDRVDETGEMRWHALGSAGGITVLLVVHAIRELDGSEIIRVISARQATRKERQKYDQARSEDPTE